MNLLTAGFKRDRVAELMDISRWTLESQIRHVYVKWDVHKMKDALAIWKEESWKYK